MHPHVLRILSLPDSTYVARIWMTTATSSQCVYQTEAHPYRASAYRDACEWIIRHHQPERRSPSQQPSVLAAA